jgi:hypothetical protein
MSDLELDREYKRGDKGPKVKLIQEWLCLHGIQVKLDGDFGAATESAVKTFQQRSQLNPDGVVATDTFAKLIQPMTDALQPLPVANGNLGGVVVMYARQHLGSSPREVGGQNRGPWVRLYMDGKEGEEFAWCAGFACFVLKQAANTVGAPVPIRPSVSCDDLAANAKQRGIFLAGGVGVDHSRLKPGSFFLNRKQANDWVHTGIVTQVDPEAFQTIEGNTNDEGSREGYEVCQRVRPYGDRDFILIA